MIRHPPNAVPSAIASPAERITHNGGAEPCGSAPAGIRTLATRVLTLIAPVPAATHVAPINPPNRACEDDDGSPTSQVTRFHRIAPTNPAKITVVVIFASFTRPLEIVRATWTDNNAPARFNTPDSSTATLGDRAPVAIEVATAFAVSWNPLVKSNNNAVMITSTTRVSPSGPPR